MFIWGTVIQVTGHREEVQSLVLEQTVQDKDGVWDLGKKKTLTFLNTTQTCIRNQNQLCHCFSFLTFFFLNPVIVLLPTCVLNQRMEPKKQEHATEKQIYSAADTSPHVTRRWKPRGAINYLSFIFVTSDILYIKKVKAL